MSIRIRAAIAIVAVCFGVAEAGAQSPITRDSWIENGRRVAVEVEGEVEYTDDSRAVESMMPGSSFELQEDRPGTPTRRVELRAMPGGSIERRYWVDGSLSPFDPSAERWFQELLREVIRKRSSSSSSRSSSATSSVTIEPPIPPAPPESPR